VLIGLLQREIIAARPEALDYLLLGGIGAVIGVEEEVLGVVGGKAVEWGSPVDVVVS